MEPLTLTGVEQDTDNNWPNNVDRIEQYFVYSWNTVLIRWSDMLIVLEQGVENAGILS